MIPDRPRFRAATSGTARATVACRIPHVIPTSPACLFYKPPPARPVQNLKKSRDFFRGFRPVGQTACRLESKARNWGLPPFGVGNSFGIAVA